MSQTNPQPDTIIQIQEAKVPPPDVYNKKDFNDEDRRRCCSPYMKIFYISFFFGLIRMLGVVCGLECIETRNDKRARKYALCGLALSIILVLLIFGILWASGYDFSS